MDNCQFFDSPTQAHRPFDHLPTELLALVLTWNYKVLGSNQERFKFPLTTSQLISRRWRDITISTPTLWTTLQINQNTPYASLESYLERSGNMPLNLDIRNVGPPLVPLAHARRWASVTLWMRSSQAAEELLQQISPASKSLRHLSCIFQYLPSRRKLLTKFGSLFPHLVSLHLTNAYPNWATSLLYLKDVTELVIRMKGGPKDMDVEGFMGTLSASPQLRHLELFNFIVPNEDIISCFRNKDQHTAVQLINLEELVLGDLFITEFLFLVYQLDCPSLRALGVGLMEYDEPLDLIDAEVDWSAYSPVYPHLQRLDLWSLDPDVDHLQLAIRNIRSISHLAIRGSGLYPLDVHHLAQSFSQFQFSVHTLHTRNISPPTLRKLNDFFPNTEKNYIHWRDMDRITESEETIVGLTNVDRKNREIILWGESDEDDWYLEDNRERDTKIERVFTCTESA